MPSSDRNTGSPAVVAVRFVFRFLLAVLLLLGGVLLFRSVASAATGTSDISVSKSGPATAKPGDNVTYTVSVTNNGPDAATNVTMNDTLPAAESFQSASFGPGVIPGSFCSLPAPGGGGIVHCVIPGLSNGQTNSFLITVQVLGTVPDASLVTNTATVGSDQSDPNSSGREPSAGPGDFGGWRAGDLRHPNRL